MDAKKLARTMPWVVGLGFCAVKLVQIAIIPSSSMHPDPATGRTEAIMIAPVVSNSWNYITEPQLLVLGAVTLMSILLALFFIGLLAWNRVRAFQVALGPESESLDSEPLHGAPLPPAPKPKSRAFGRR